MNKKEEKLLEQPSKTITEEELITKDREKIDELRGYKTNFEPRWYISSAFYDGKHFTYGKKDSAGNWLSVKQPKNKVIREIPKAKKQLQNIRNMILKLQRKPVVYPDMNVIGLMDPMLAKVEEEQAKQQGRVLQYFWEEVIRVDRYFPKLIKLAQLHSHAMAQILNHGDGRYEIEILDGFDVSIYPVIQALKDHKKFVKHISKTINQLRDNPLYDQAVLDEIEEEMGDGKHSASSYKEDLMVQKFGKANKKNVLLDELYEIVLMPDDSQAEPEEGDDDERDLVERVRIVSYIGEKKLAEQIVPLSKLPGAIYVWGDEAYETSLMEDMMPGNKSYDILVSKLEAKAKKLDTGRYAIQKGEDTKVLTTDDGEIIRWKRNKPTVMEESQLSSTFMEALNLLDGDMKEQGISISSGADIPAGIKAARAIEALKESDYATLGVPMDNFDFFIVELSESLIEMIAYDTVDIAYARSKNKDGGFDQIRYIGKRGADIYKKLNVNLPSDVVVINPNRSTKVEVESGIAHTETGKKELLLEIAGTLANQGTPLPPEVILDGLNFGNTQDVVEKIKYYLTFGKTLLDMPDFKVLPVELQQAIVVYLSRGAVNAPSAPAGATPPAEAPVAQQGAAPAPSQDGAPWRQ